MNDRASEQGLAANRLPIGEFVLDLLAGELLTAEGGLAGLRRQALEVLLLLGTRCGQVVSKDELMERVWPGLVVGDGSLTQAIADIRRVLGDQDHTLVRNVARRGYMLVPGLPVRAVSLPASQAAAAAAAAAAPAPAPAPASAPASAPESEPAPAPAPVAMRRRWSAVLGVLGLTLLIGTASVLAIRGGEPLRQAGAAKPPLAEQVPALSIAVMPLSSRNGNARLDYLAEAMTEEITVDLSRIPGSFVIARSSADSYRGRKVDARQVGRELGVRYVLEGSLDRLDDEIRLSLQLVDADSRRTLWAERFDGPLGEAAALHRRITGTVAQSLQQRLIQAESARASQKAAGDASAYDLTLQAWSMLRERTPASVAAARDTLQRALARDPQSALAWSLLADSYSADVAARWLQLRRASREQWLDLAAQAAERAYAIDPNHSSAVGARATVLSLQGRSQQALAMVERKLALNRNDATAWYRLSYTHATLGRAEESIKAGLEAVRLSPRDPERCGFYVVIAAAHLHLKQDLAALDWARKSALERPDFSVARAWIASAAANIGDMGSAQLAVAEFRRMLPDYTVGSFRAERLCANALCETQRERFYAGLNAAGLPD